MISAAEFVTWPVALVGGVRSGQRAAADAPVRPEGLAYRREQRRSPSRQGGRGLRWAAPSRTHPGPPPTAAQPARTTPTPNAARRRSCESGATAIQGRGGRTWPPAPCLQSLTARGHAGSARGCPCCTPVFEAIDRQVAGWVGHVGRVPRAAGRFWARRHGPAAPVPMVAAGTTPAPPSRVLASDVRGLLGQRVGMLRSRRWVRRGGADHSRRRSARWVRAAGGRAVRPS
jgi:hypothetical protein